MATMAFPYDVNGINSALGAQGSSYRLPSFMGAQDATSAPPPAAPAITTQAPQQPVPAVQQLGDTEVAGAPQDGGSDGLETMKQMSDMAKSNEKPKMDGMERMGNLVGTVLSAYTGNYAGAMGGLGKLQQ